MEAAELLKICRLCATNGPNVRAIFNGQNEKNEIGEKISKCLPILISSDDELPGHICPMCLRSLNTSYKLLMMVIETDEKLRQQLSQSRINKHQQDYEPLSHNVTGEAEEKDPGTCGFYEINFVDTGAFASNMETVHQSLLVCNLCHNSFDNAAELQQHKHKTHDNIDNPGGEDCHDSAIVEIKDEGILVSQDSNTESSASKKTIGKTFSEKMDDIIEEDDVVSVDSATSNKSLPDAKAFGVGGIRFRRKHDMLRHRSCHRDKKINRKHQQQLSQSNDDDDHQKSEQKSQDSSHGTEKSESLMCGLSEITFVDVSTFDSPIKIFHQSKWGCNQNSFATSEELRQQKYKKFQKRHANQTCRPCSMKFADFRSFTAHLKKVHDIRIPVDGKFACKQCLKSFPKLRLLQDHQNIHSRKEPYRCETCDKRFRTYPAKWSHEQNHKREGYVCDYCQSSFKTKQSLVRHIQLHLPPELWRYECKICQDKFNRPEHLKDHVRSHSQNHHVHECDICKAQFRHKQSMLRHRKRHPETARIR